MMLAKLSTLFALATIVLAANLPRVDDRAEVKIPAKDKGSLAKLCKAWTQECIDLAHREGKAGYECEKGYAGKGTASVLCYAESGNTTTNFTPKVVKALKLKPA
ncbi:hypothetical protein FIBSPDRAFT_925829 [Athelia psychrophila]|uniref:Extracellular membrane protein CFEM domain-containing protein n=1 Tax=Athelia psychrophila TaxID=1759441 RepID=A0A166UEC1_9AGAM|nr:hypothetical protein FIBSPDRAFT_925829 [Fibularhizoctonia sp. CBS 109695]